MLRLAAFLRQLADALDPAPRPTILVFDLASYYAVAGQILLREIAEQAMMN